MTYPKVTLFIQCLVDAMFPSTGEAMLAIFDKLGIRYDYPLKQTCCGQPAYNSGYRKDAAEAAKHFIQTFENAEVIVCPSGSCVHMIRHHYPELLQQDTIWSERVKSIADRTFELSEFIVDELRITDLGSKFSGTVTYHDSCHLKSGLGIAEQPRALLHNIEGLELIEMKNSDSCCGFGGTFSVHYPEISTAMVDEKIENILATGATFVTGCDTSCLMNIGGRLSRRGERVQALHLADLLAGERGGSR